MKKILIACAYFDWFSNYQEVGLALALRAHADVHVIAGDRANPLFTDENLRRIEQPRIYPTGTTNENSIRISRFKTREFRSMLFSKEYKQAVANDDYDLIVQVMPGFILPALASRPIGSAPRVVLYGDNRAMYENLSPLGQKLKRAAFFATKGLVYRYCNRGATLAYCYTPDTINRLRPFLGSTQAKLLPLAFDSASFFYSKSVRENERARLGFNAEDLVVATAGKAYHTKRVDLLVKAFDRVAEGHPNLKLVVAGMLNGSGSREVREAINDSPFKDRIVSLPLLKTQELNALFNASDIGCWPIMPAVTIQQAMGTGLPVVLPRNNMVGHLLREEGSGLYYAPSVEDTRPLANALQDGLGLVVENCSRSALASSNQWLSSQQIALDLISLLEE